MKSQNEIHSIEMSIQMGLSTEIAESWIKGTRGGWEFPLYRVHSCLSYLLELVTFKFPIVSATCVSICF